MMGVTTDLSFSTDISESPKRMENFYTLAYNLSIQVKQASS
jgi:hypothetical protein